MPVTADPQRRGKRRKRAPAAHIGYNRRMTGWMEKRRRARAPVEEAGGGEEAGGVMPDLKNLVP